MYSFKYDYSEGAHPSVLEAMMKSNAEQMDGYGDDRCTTSAIDYIRKEIGDDSTGIYLLSGGTQTNLTAICAMLRPHEAVISPVTGHINVHEAGAVEATGHRIVGVLTEDGKLKAESVLQAVKEHTDCHMVKPRMVYISNSTELGTVYSKYDLENLSGCCRDNGMYLFMDGARLGAALTSKSNDLTMRDIAALCDAFYIGGTKNGALIGEALVMCNPRFKEDMPYVIKQRGGLLAKGRLLGAQFEELFRDGLYYRLAAHANGMAAKLADAFEKRGAAFLAPPQTNQLFPVLTNDQINRLQKDFDFYVWKEMTAETSAVRLVTSWATREETVKEFIELYETLK